MELTFAQQSTAFLWSMLLGVFFGIAYGPFKIFRMCFCSGKVSVFAVDFIYMILVSVSVFYFSLGFLCGYVRAYTYFGCLIGFLAYRLTAGRFTSRIYSPLIRFTKRIMRKIVDKIKKIVKKLLKTAHNILYNIKKKRVSNNKRLKNDSNKRVTSENEKR